MGGLRPEPPTLMPLYLFLTQMILLFLFSWTRRGEQAEFAVHGAERVSVVAPVCVCVCVPCVRVRACMCVCGPNLVTSFTLRFCPSFWAPHGFNQSFLFDSSPSSLSHFPSSHRHAHAHHEPMIPPPSGPAPVAVKLLPLIPQNAESTPARASLPRHARAPVPPSPVP